MLKVFDIWKTIPVPIRCSFWLSACASLSWLALEAFRPAGCFQTSHPHLLSGAIAGYFGILCLVDHAWGWCISKSIGIACSAWHSHLPPHLAPRASEHAADRASDFLNRHCESITATVAAALGALNFTLLSDEPTCGPYGSMLLHFLLCLGFGAIISPLAWSPISALLSAGRKI